MRVIVGVVVGVEASVLLIGAIPFEAVFDNREEGETRTTVLGH